MELPFNTTISRDMLKGTRPVRRRRSPSWATKRRWVRRGVRRARARRLSRRQRLHRGEGSGARPRSSIAIASGRAPTWSASASRRSATSTASTCRTSTRGRPTPPASRRGELPLARAYRPTADERLIRELVLQLKRGRVAPAYFARQVRRRRPRSLRARRSRRCSARATWPTLGAGSHRADARRRCCASTSLLPRFFLPQHTGIRYT